MIHDLMPNTEEQLSKGVCSAYVGTDLTASDFLHIGHLVSVMMLKHLKGRILNPSHSSSVSYRMIGDPSMKSQERNLLDEATLRHNQEAIGKQLATCDFDTNAPNAATWLTTTTG